MKDKIIIYRNDNGEEVEGKVILVYNDALASGTKEYVSITALLVENEDGVVDSIIPSRVIKVLKENE